MSVSTQREGGTKGRARPAGNNADEWTLWCFEHAGHGAAYLGVQIAEAIDEHMERSAILDRSQVVRVYPVDDVHGFCVGGRFDGWMMWRHPDGQWVSLRKLTAEYPSSPLSRATATSEVER